jgi:hypothetical protein
MAWHQVPLHVSLLSWEVSHPTGTLHLLDLKVRLSMAWHYVTVHLSLSYCIWGKLTQQVHHPDLMVGSTMARHREMVLHIYVRTNKAFL